MTSLQGVLTFSTFIALIKAVWLLVHYSLEATVSTLQPWSSVTSSTMQPWSSLTFSTLQPEVLLTGQCHNNAIPELSVQSSEKLVIMSEKHLSKTFYGLFHSHLSGCVSVRHFCAWCRCREIRDSSVLGRGGVAMGSRSGRVSIWWHDVVGSHRKRKVMSTQPWHSTLLPLLSVAVWRLKRAIQPEMLKALARHTERACQLRRAKCLEKAPDGDVAGFCHCQELCRLRSFNPCFGILTKHSLLTSPQRDCSQLAGIMVGGYYNHTVYQIFILRW